MSAQDYAITFGYGATDDEYYGPAAQGKSTYIGPYHRGDDRAMPVGTPVLVNGVQIGLSGNGNGRYGAHLHVGKFIGGVDTNPRGGGFTLDGAKVITVVSSYATDPVNAKYVRIQDSSGAQWVFLHMSQTSVQVGDVLTKKDNGDNMPNGGDVVNAFHTFLNREPSDGEIKAYTASTWNNLFYTLSYSKEYANRVTLNEGDVVNIYQALLKRKATNTDKKTWIGRTFKDLVYAIINSSEYANKK